MLQIDVYTFASPANSLNVTRFLDLVDVTQIIYVDYEENLTQDAILRYTIVTVKISEIHLPTTNPNALDAIS